MDCCIKNNPAPTWRLCHPVNIYVFKNGYPTEKPQLIHIPTEKKKNMTTVLEEIAARMKIPVGYPIALYEVDGTRICKTYELQMYSYYVVVTNLEKTFKCVNYGNVKQPLVVIGHNSKHVHTLQFQNKNYDLFCRRKAATKKLHELISQGEKNGLGPTELTGLGRPCGVLCNKIAPTPRIQPTQCCSDEIMPVEGEEAGEDGGYVNLPDGYCSAFQDKELDELANHVRSKKEGKCSQLMNLIKRYQHVGSDIFKMFQNKINSDLEDNRSMEACNWNLPADEKDTDNAILKVQDELKKIAEVSCQYAFDKDGNIIGSPGCSVSHKVSNSIQGNDSTIQSGSLPFSNNEGRGSKASSHRRSGEIITENQSNAPFNSPSSRGPATPTERQSLAGSQTQEQSTRASLVKTRSEVGSQNGIQSPTRTPTRKLSLQEEAQSYIKKLSFHQEQRSSMGETSGGMESPSTYGKSEGEGGASPVSQVSPKELPSSPISAHSPPNSTPNERKSAKSSIGGGGGQHKQSESRSSQVEPYSNYSYY